MVLFHFPHLIAEYSASRAGRSASPTMFVFQGCTCCPHSTADHLCWGFGLAVYSKICRLHCPPVTGQPAPQAGDWKSSLYTLFPSGSQQRHESSQHFSRCCIHLQRPLKAPHAPASGPLPSTAPSVTLGAPILTDWHISLSLVS